MASCSGPFTWHCEAPNPDAACPPARPNLGTTCSVEGQLCTYGCEPKASRQCVEGGWIEASAPGGCPISTREAKQEIHYLSGRERAVIAQAARDLKLATYRYRGSARGARRHLGFILEDSPRCPAADLKQRQVDLYAFTSMVLALVQEQQHQIAALQRELAELRRQRRP